MSEVARVIDKILNPTDKVPYEIRGIVTFARGIDDIESGRVKVRDLKKIFRRGQ